MILIQSNPAPDLTREAAEEASPYAILRFEYLPSGELLIEFNGNMNNQELGEMAKKTRTTTTSHDLKSAAISAIAANDAWRTNTLPQIQSGADAIIAAASSSAQEKQLAQGIKSVASALGSHSQILNAVIKLVLDRLDQDD